MKRSTLACAVGDVPTVLAGLDEKVIWNETEGNMFADGNPYIGPLKPCLVTHKTHIVVFCVPQTTELELNSRATLCIAISPIN